VGRVLWDAALKGQSPVELGDLHGEPPPNARTVYSNLQGSRQPQQDTSVAPEGMPDQDPAQNRSQTEMEMERGYPGGIKKPYLARQGWSLQSSAGTETSTDVKGNKKGLYRYISNESQGKYELAAKWGGQPNEALKRLEVLDAFLALVFIGKVCHPDPCV